MAFEILHILAQNTTDLESEVLSNSSLTKPQFKFLLELGSVYLNKKRVLKNTQLKINDYIRVHCQPKRFAIADFNWSEAVVFENDAFIVVNKFAHCPIHSSLDNIVENHIYQLEKELNTNLYITHRLDNPTSGLFLLAKNKAFQKAFNSLLANNLVGKKYRCLSLTKLELGVHKHFMLQSKESPKNILAQRKNGADLECSLEVLCSNKANGNSTFCKSLTPFTNTNETPSSVYYNEIKLISGRTHQIRAQLAFLQAPIIGDIEYGGIESKFFALQSFQLSFPYLGEEIRFVLNS